MDKYILLGDFEKAVSRFAEAVEIPTDDDVRKAGCIQYFEFSFELAWKTIKQFANDQGIQDCNSPKSSLKYAFKSGWINDEDIWLDMLASRNRMSHTYSATTALTVYEKLSSFVVTLERLVLSLTQITD